MGLSVVNRPIRPAGLSPALRAIALAAAPDRCVIIVTHDNRIFKYADRMTHMEDGRIHRTDDNVEQIAQHN